MDTKYMKLVDYLTKVYGEFKYVGIKGEEEIKKRVQEIRDNHYKKK